MSVSNLSMAVSTKIDAINAGLRALGSVGINSLDEVDSNIDASSVDKLIDQHSQNLQSNSGRGWWFNRESFHALTPDPVNGYVSVPSNTLAVLVHRVNGQPTPVTLRGQKLFDTQSLGYDFRNATLSDGKVHCTLVVCLDYDTLPPTAKQAVSDLACFWAVNDLEGDINKMKSYQMAAELSVQAVQSEDTGQRRQNMFNNPSIRNDVWLAGGYNNVR